MTNWKFKLESVDALAADTQRFIVGLYPEGVLLERSNIDIPTAKIEGLQGEALVAALLPGIQILIDEVSPAYEEAKALQEKESAIQQAVQSISDQLFDI